MDKNEVIKNLKIISRLLDNLRYECCAREYTLDEDAMGDVLSARDIADELIRSLADEG